MRSMADEIAFSIRPNPSSTAALGKEALSNVELVALQPPPR